MDQIILSDKMSPWMDELKEKVEQFGGVEVTPLEFYRDVFPEGSIEECKPPHSDPAGHNGNPLMLIQQVKGDETRWITKVVHDDLRWINGWDEIEGAENIYMSGLAYLGKKRDLDHAVTMHAMVFDLDVETVEGLYNFLYGTNVAKPLYPKPDYIALSGRGVHLYYVFAEPLIIYHGEVGRVVKGQLKTLKMELTRLIWNPYTIGNREKGMSPQYQGINQGFRLPGSYTKPVTGNDGNAYRYRVPVYKMPKSEPTTLDELYSIASSIPDNKKYMAKGTSKTGKDLEYWKEHSPEWYQRRIVEGDKERRHWKLSENLYQWFYDRVKNEARYGHRYHCMFCIVVYGVKCGVPKWQVEDDLKALLPRFAEMRPGDPITEDDVYEALGAYQDKYHTYPVSSLSFLSGIDLRSNTRRNGRKRDIHLKGARAIRDINNPNWRQGNGRPDKHTIVAYWQLEHPDGKKADCIKDTGLAKHTVYKWWNIPDQEAQECFEDPQGFFQRLVDKYEAEGRTKTPQNAPADEKVYKTTSDDDIGLEEQDKAILRALEEPISGTQMEYDEVYDVVQKIKRKKEDEI